MTGEERLIGLGMILVTVFLVLVASLIFINQQSGRDNERECIKSGHTLGQDDEGYKTCRI